jgi:hypothetical protein
MTSGLKDVENTDNIQIGNQGRGKNDLFQITRIFEFGLFDLKAAGARIVILF